MSYLLAEKSNLNGEIPSIQLAAHASDFVCVSFLILAPSQQVTSIDNYLANYKCPHSIAGSETTATTLSVVMDYVCRDARISNLLVNEIRTNFTSFEEINSTSTAILKYLHAVCQEALRIFPPLPLGLPRVVPKGGDTVDGHFIPEDVGLCPFRFPYSPLSPLRLSIRQEFYLLSCAVAAAAMVRLKTSPI